VQKLNQRERTRKQFFSTLKKKKSHIRNVTGLDEFALCAVCGGHFVTNTKQKNKQQQLQP
jgi:hypothetical protein